VRYRARVLAICQMKPQQPARKPVREAVSS
jgi:hypothetical protein